MVGGLETGANAIGVVIVAVVAIGDVDVVAIVVVGSVTVVLAAVALDGGKADDISRASVIS